MDMVLGRLNPESQRLLNMITSILGVIMWLVITWFAISATWEAYQLGDKFIYTYRVPKWPFMLVICAGSLLLFIQFIRRTYGFSRSRRVSQD